MAPAVYYVNPATGNDAAAGTQDAPLKTIAHALKLGKSGDQIRLAPGNYTIASGEEFPLVMRAGIAVMATNPREEAIFLLKEQANISAPQAPASTSRLPFSCKETPNSRE